jgi:hypothetical protein
VAGRVGHIKVESIARVVLACWRQITGGSRNLAQPPKMESRGILYLPYCTCHYIHIMSAQETSEKGLGGAGKLPGCGLPRAAEASAGTYAGVAGILQADQKGSDVASGCRRSGPGSNGLDEASRRELIGGLRKLMSEQRKISVE